MNNRLSSLLLVIAGSLLIIFKEEFVIWIILLCGIIIALIGLWQVIKKKESAGYSLIALGIIISICGFFLITLAAVLIGMIFTLLGIFQFSNLSIQMSYYKGYPLKKFFLLLSPILEMGIGLFLIVSVFTEQQWVYIVIGIVIIIEGITKLVNCNKSPDEVEVIKSEKL